MVILLVAAFALYLAGGVKEAWLGYRAVVQEIAEGNPLITLLFHSIPILLIAFFVWAVADKIRHTKQIAHTKREKAVDFETPGVTVSYTDGTRRFIPYAGTAFEVIVTVHTVRGKYGDITVVSSIEMKFRQPEESISILHSAFKPFPFLTRLLDKRRAFSSFRLMVNPLSKESFSHQQAAKSFRESLQNYIDYGVLLDIKPQMRWTLWFLVFVYWGAAGGTLYICFVGFLNSVPLYIPLFIGIILGLPGLFFLFKAIQYEKRWAQLKRLKKTK